jgi:hypothetical protein
VHNAKKRGKARLNALVAAIVTHHPEHRYNLLFEVRPR